MQFDVELIPYLARVWALCSTTI